MNEPDPSLEPSGMEARELARWTPQGVAQVRLAWAAGLHAGRLRGGHRLRQRCFLMGLAGLVVGVLLGITASASWRRESSAPAIAEPLTQPGPDDTPGLATPTPMPQATPATWPPSSWGELQATILTHGGLVAGLPARSTTSTAESALPTTPAITPAEKSLRIAGPLPPQLVELFEF